MLALTLLMMMMMTPLRRTSKVLNLLISHQIVPVAILNFLMRWSFCQRRFVRMEVLSVPWMKRNQSQVSDLFILDLVIIVFVFVKALFSICFFHSMLFFSYQCFICLALNTGTVKPTVLPKRVTRVRVRFSFLAYRGTPLPVPQYCGYVRVNS